RSRVTLSRDLKGAGQFLEPEIKDARIASWANKSRTEGFHLEIIFAADAQGSPELPVGVADRGDTLHRGKHVGMTDLAELADAVRIVAGPEENAVHSGCRHDFVGAREPLLGLDLAENHGLAVL